MFLENLKNILSLSHNETRLQRIADIIFGIIAPILCIYFDPIVFRGANSCANGDLYLNKQATFAYTAIGLGIFALIVWLSVESSAKKISAFFAGIFFIGFIFSTLLGLRILPFSLLGLIVCFGVIGFIPFLTALVYWRNGIKAFRWAQKSKSYHWSIKVALAILGIVIVLGIPAWAQQRYPPIIPTNNCSNV